MPHPFSQLLAALRSFVSDEQQAANRKLLDVWERPLAEKLAGGWSQGFTHLERADASLSLWAHLDVGESRFREGDLLLLHSGNPSISQLGRGLSLEAEEDGRWLLRGNCVPAVLSASALGRCYADPDGMNLTPYFERSLNDISTSQIGLEVVLPLLAGTLDITFDARDVAEGERVALAEGFNPKQAEAVGLAFGAEQMACIQGPPGTGKTRVLLLLVRLMVERGERVLMTSAKKPRSYASPTARRGRYSKRRTACCRRWTALPMTTI